MNKTFVVMLIYLLYSCNNKQEDKLIIERDNQGNIRFKASYYLSASKDTLVDGNVIYYFPNGNIEDSFKMVAGLKNGFYYRFDSTGYLRSQMNYLNNKKDGYSYLYYRNGAIEVEELFRADSVLYTKNYFPNGQLESYFIFIDKVQSGYYLVYDSLGKKMEEGGDSNKIKKW